MGRACERRPNENGSVSVCVSWSCVRVPYVMWSKSLTAPLGANRCNAFGVGRNVRGLSAVCHTNSDATCASGLHSKQSISSMLSILEWKWLCIGLKKTDWQAWQPRVRTLYIKKTYTYTLHIIQKMERNLGESICINHILWDFPRFNLNIEYSLE